MKKIRKTKNIQKQKKITNKKMNHLLNCNKIFIDT